MTVVNISSRLIFILSRTMKLTYILILPIIVICQGIGEDYFLDKDDQSTKYRNENQPNILQGEPKTVQLSNKNVTSNSSGSHFKDHIANKGLSIDENVSDSEIVSGRRVNNPEYTDINNILHDTSQSKESDVSKSNIILNALKKHIFSNEEMPSVFNTSLRTQDDDIELDYKINGTEEIEGNNTETTDDEESNEKLLVDFYNLQPAENIIDDEAVNTGKQFLFNTQHRKNRSTWYVPENLPCWDLPILYGEIEQKKANREVFLLLSGELKNVIESDEAERFYDKKRDIPISQSINKWCGSGPCYGDHTLCLFPDLTNSKLCTNGYEVSTPTMIDRTGLENTINSMRNRIASGATDLYKHLPTAANMKQIIYDFDLEMMAKAWLHQCLPGPNACSSLDGNYVAQLECTKYADNCCLKSHETVTSVKCIPKLECFINPVIGCLYAWFRSAIYELTATDVQCGHMTPGTYNTVQLLWADTNKIGCAYGTSPWGEVRVVCNFAPGAPFSIYTKSFCGFISQDEMIEAFNGNIMSSEFLAGLGIHLRQIRHFNFTEPNIIGHDFNYSLRFTDVDILSKVYKGGWIRKQLSTYSNGTLGFSARLVTKYIFGDDNGPQCDSNRHIYEIGEPASQCVETGKRYNGLCYDFCDPTPGYRMVAVLAPVALFSLILYDLFSGVVRQTNY